MKRWLFIPILFLIITFPVYAVTNYSEEALKYLADYCTPKKAKGYRAVLCWFNERLTSLESSDNEANNKISELENKLDALEEQVEALLISPSPFPTATPQTILFQDSFESGINPTWINENNGFVISQTQVHDGSYSVTTNGIIDRKLAKDLGAKQTNTTYEGWFYDSGGMIEETLIAVSETNPTINVPSQGTFSVGLDTMQSLSHYSYFLGWTSYTTSIIRSNGWHKVTFITNGIQNSVYIDDTLIINTTFQPQWQFISLYANGWHGSVPHSVGYWDEVKVYQN